MLSEEFLEQIYKTRQEQIDEKISKEYHKRIKQIKNEEEKDNIKLSIISELYYKEGFKDGINFISNYIQKI